jgi:hypothetical protein
MADIKPLGSEKLQGVDKLKRIMEIARYNETPKNDINELSTTNYTITLADGMTYGIVKEKSGYILKKGINESELDYSDPMKNRKYYRSYSEAMKKLNLVAAEVNRVTGNVFETPLIGEQEVKKKFILKTPKPKPPVEVPAPEPEASLPPSPETTAPAPPSPEGGDMGMPPADGSDMGMPPADGSDMGMPPADGSDMGMPPADGSDMGMGMEEPEMGMEEPEMGMEGPEMDDEQPQGPSGLKSIQRLTGKLSQKIRAFDKDKGLDSQDIKYVINSILSSIDLDNLDEDDKDDILSKFEDSDEYGMEGEGDLDLSGEDDMGDFDMEDTGMELPPMEEPAPAEDFKESVEDVLSKYFVVTDEEKKLHEEKNKKNFIKNKLVSIEVKNEIERMSESVKQMNTAKRFLNENVNAKFIGKTNKQNLVFSVNGKNIKVNTAGNII